MQEQNSSKALSYVSFRWYLASTLFLTLGLQMQVVLVGQRLFDLTHDPLSLGLNGLFQAIPALSVALFAGTLVDSLNRKKLALVAMLPILVSVLGLLALSSQWELAKPFQEAKYFYCFLVLNGLSRGFLSPASFAIVGEILPPSAYVNGAGWNSVLWQGGTILGPLLAGFLYSTVGPFRAFEIEFVLICSAIFCCAHIQMPKRVHLQQKVTSGKDILQNVFPRAKEGLRFVFNSPVLLGAFALDMLAVLFGGIEAIFPVFSESIFKAGPEGLGLMRAAPAAGSTLMALIITQFPPIKRAGPWLMMTILFFALANLGFALTNSFPLAIFFLFLTGIFDQVSVVIRQTLTQLLTPNELKGRVASVRSIFIGMSNEIGAFESGLTAKYMGAVNSVLFGSGVTIFILSIFALKAKGLRNYSFPSSEEGR